jgi:hypothetical protein
LNKSLKRNQIKIQNGCDRERISPIMMLVWLAPDIEEAAPGVPPATGRALR